MKFGDLSYFFENQNLKPAFHPFDGKSHQCGIGKINVLEGNKLNTQVALLYFNCTVAVIINFIASKVTATVNLF